MDKTAPSSLIEGTGHGAGARAARPSQLIDLAAVGVSTSSTCGVRDYAVLLADALSDQDVRCALQWLWREDRSLRGGRSEIAQWTRGLSADLERAPLDAVLMHYSVFAYSYRGFPLFAAPTLVALRRLRVPIVTILHEYAYPWRLGGARGTAWAVAQRALLVEVMRASSGVVVTADARAEWLRSRRWLPRRPVAVAPVFSNLPRPAADARPAGPVATVGVFGYAYEGVPIELMLDALGMVAERHGELELVLLGAPGTASAAGQAWLDAARARPMARSPVFSGTLPAQDLSDALARCELLLFADPSGPTSRKTTLAASLASGRPVVALDGPRTWRELADADAALVSAPTAPALADAVAGLLGDAAARDSLARRGREFAEGTMSAERSAKVVRGLLEHVLGEREPA